MGYVRTSLFLRVPAAIPRLINCMIVSACTKEDFTRTRGVSRGSILASLYKAKLENRESIPDMNSKNSDLPQFELSFATFAALDQPIFGDNKASIPYRGTHFQAFRLDFLFIGDEMGGLILTYVSVAPRCERKKHSAYL